MNEAANLGKSPGLHDYVVVLGPIDLPANTRV